MDRRIKNLLKNWMWFGCEIFRLHTNCLNAINDLDNEKFEIYNELLTNRVRNYDMLKQILIER